MHYFNHRRWHLCIVSHLGFHYSFCNRNTLDFNLSFKGFCNWDLRSVCRIDLVLHSKSLPFLFEINRQQCNEQNKKSKGEYSHHVVNSIRVIQIRTNALLI